MITGSQIRAARGLINISQDELAELAGLTPQGIRKIEDGSVQPRGGTIADITQVFSDRGVEFTENNGVRQKPTNIEIFEGPDRFEAFCDFVYEQVKTQGGDVCLSVSDERLFSKYRSQADTIAHYERMQALFDKGILKSFRILANQSSFASKYNYNEYKWQPESSVAPTAFYVFADCLALLSFVHPTPPYVAVLRSAPLASSYRQAFNAAWALAKDPPKLKQVGQ